MTAYNELENIYNYTSGVANSPNGSPDGAHLAATIAQAAATKQLVEQQRVANLIELHKLGIMDSELFDIEEIGGVIPSAEYSLTPTYADILADRNHSERESS